MLKRFITLAEMVDVVEDVIHRSLQATYPDYFVKVHYRVRGAIHRLYFSTD